MDRAFQRIHSLMLRGTFYSVPPRTKNNRDLLIDKFEEEMLAESLGGTMGMVKPFYSCT